MSDSFDGFCNIPMPPPFFFKISRYATSFDFAIWLANASGLSALPRTINFKTLVLICAKTQPISYASAVTSCLLKRASLI